MKGEFITCRFCGTTQDVGCDCPDGPVQELKPCLIHGPHEGIMLWDGRSKYGFPAGGNLTFCVPCDKARRTEEAGDATPHVP